MPRNAVTREGIRFRGLVHVNRINIRTIPREFREPLVFRLGLSTCSPQWRTLVNDGTRKEIFEGYARTHTR